MSASEALGLASSLLDSLGILGLITASLVAGIAVGLAKKLIS